MASCITHYIGSQYQYQIESYVKVHIYFLHENVSNPLGTVKVLCKQNSSKPTVLLKSVRVTPLLYHFRRTEV